MSAGPRSADLVRAGEEEGWLDLGADGSIDAVAEAERLLFRQPGDDGGRRWLSAPAGESDPVTVFLRVTQLGDAAQWLFPGGFDPVEEWEWIEEQQDAGRTSPIEAVEGEPRSPQVFWTTDGNGTVVSTRAVPRDGPEAEVEEVTVRLLGSDRIPARPSVRPGDVSPIADEPVLPYLLASSIIDPACGSILGDAPDIPDCVAGLAGDRTIREWVEERGIQRAIQLVECRDV